MIQETRGESYAYLSADIGHHDSGQMFHEARMGSLPNPEEEVGMGSREWELQKPLKISSDSTIKNKPPNLKMGEGLE